MPVINGKEFKFVDDQGWPKEDDWVPIPDYGDVMTLEAFIRDCKDRSLIDYDGSGHYAKMTTIVVGDETRIDMKMYELINVYPSDVLKGKIPAGMTHVVWFNK